MAQTLEPSQEKVSSKLEETLSNLKVSPDVAGEFKGRIPTGIKDQVVAINKEKRQSKKQLIKKNKKGAVVQQKKLDAFLEEFMSNGGNATNAAAAVFNVSSRASAATIGSYYLKRAKMLGRLYLEKEGYSYGRLLTIAARKAEMSRLPDWFDRVWEIGGYGSFGGKNGGAPVTNVNIIQTEKELFKKYAMTEGELIDDEPTEEEENEVLALEEGDAPDAD